MGQVSTLGAINSFVHLPFGELEPLLRKVHIRAIFTHNFKGFTEALRHNHGPRTPGEESLVSRVLLTKLTFSLPLSYVNEVSH